MAWRTKSVMDQRVELVLRVKEGEEALAELCREYGISRPTGYLWLNRYEQAASVDGLAERSRAPKRCLVESPPEQKPSSHQLQTIITTGFAQKL